jgi:hypothetical protein
VYVNIIHSAQRRGIRRTPVYFMTVTAKFSKTERAIIKRRHLKETWAAIAPGVLNFPDDASLRTIGLIFILAGTILSLNPTIYSWDFFSTHWYNDGNH